MERLRNRNKSGVRRGMRRYAARKNRSTLRGKYYLSNDIMRAKIEVYDQLYIPNGTSAVQFAVTGNTYRAVYDLLAASTSWTDQVGLYARYKITGLQVVASCCSSPDTIDGSFATGAPTISLAFYPNATGQNLGTNPSFNDHKMLLDAHVTTPQTKYWKFPDQYFEGPGYGFGVWSQCSGYLNQIGQLSPCLNLVSNTTANTYFFNVRMTLYVLFSDKNR